jgi:hypothetical protein
MLVFGDAIHNLRSALDHLAHLIVIAAGYEPKIGARGTAFPIVARRPPKPPTVVPLPADHPALKTIEAVQPYATGSILLDVIHRLDLVDKHRQLVVGIAGHVTTASTLPFVPDPTFTPSGSRNEGDIVGKYLSPTSTQESAVPYFGFGVCIDEPEITQSAPWPASGMVEDLLDYVAVDMLGVFKLLVP